MFTRSAKASEAAPSSSASSVDLVISPPDDGNEREEKFVDGEGMSADVAGPMEIREYRSDSEHSDAD